MGAETDEIDAKRAAEILGVRSTTAIYGYIDQGLLTAREEPRGRRRRLWFRQVEVEALRMKFDQERAKE